MAKRINIMIDEDTWRILGKVPAGARSRTVNEALRLWFERKRRGDAMRTMDRLRAQLPVVSAEEVAQWIREDRERGH